MQKTTQKYIFDHHPHNFGRKSSPFFYNFFLSFGKFDHLTKKLFMFIPLQKISLCFKK